MSTSGNPPLMHAAIWLTQAFLSPFSPYPRDIKGTIATLLPFPPPRGNRNRLQQPESRALRRSPLTSFASKGLTKLSCPTLPLPASASHPLAS
eukprot:617244-Pelagomonas_calceolata.AAC.1